MAKVILEGYVLVADSDLSAIKGTLPKHIQLTRQEEGCLKFEVSQDIENKNRFNVYEEFRSEDAFKFHQQRASQSEWGQVSARLEKHYKTNNIT